MFYNISKFELVWDEFVSLSRFLQTDPSCADLVTALNTAPTVRDQLTSKHTIVQLAVLRCLDAPNRFLGVANTHLYFHPGGDHIRLLQTELSLRYLKKALGNLVLRFQSETGQPDVGLVYAGDFNSCPCTAAYQLMGRGDVPRDHIDWTKHRLPPSQYPKCACSLVLGKKERPEQSYVATDGGIAVEEGDGDVSRSDHSLDTGFQGLHLQHDFHFQSACGTPQFTNYTESFMGALDYIFVGTDHLQVTGTVTLPSLEEVREQVALPSVHFPSDHVALVCNVSWNKCSAHV